MKIKEIKLKEHISPDALSGTGYSEPETFSITLENGKDYTVIIDIWYLPKELILYRFYGEVYNQLGCRPDNMPEAFNIYANIIALKSCPYSVEELLNLTKTIYDY